MVLQLQSFALPRAPFVTFALELWPLVLLLCGASWAYSLRRVMAGSNRVA